MSKQQIWQQRQLLQELPLYPFAHFLSLQTPETSLTEKKLRVKISRMKIVDKFWTLHITEYLPTISHFPLPQTGIVHLPSVSTLYMLHACQSFGSCLTYQIKSHRVPFTICHDGLKAHESRCWKFRCVQKEMQVLPLNGTKVKVLKRNEKQHAPQQKLGHWIKVL